MIRLIATEISTGQAIAEQRGLPKSEAETFSSYGIHSARRVARLKQCCLDTLAAMFVSR